jgi:hypothetical protein
MIEGMEKYERRLDSIYKKYGNSADKRMERVYDILMKLSESDRVELMDLFPFIHPRHLNKKSWKISE